MTAGPRALPGRLVQLDADGHPTGPTELSPLPALARALAAAARSVTDAFAGLGCAMAATNSRMAQHHEPPVDPMARALHLRQHRNTGPQVHADPRRNRR